MSKRGRKLRKLRSVRQRRNNASFIRNLLNLMIDTVLDSASTISEENELDLANMTTDNRKDIDLCNAVSCNELELPSSLTCQSDSNSSDNTLSLNKAPIIQMLSPNTGQPKPLLASPEKYSDSTISAQSLLNFTDDYSYEVPDLKNFDNENSDNWFELTFMEDQFNIPSWEEYNKINEKETLWKTISDGIPSLEEISNQDKVELVTNRLLSPVNSDSDSIPSLTTTTENELQDLINQSNLLEEIERENNIYNTYSRPKLNILDIDPNSVPPLKVITDEEQQHTAQQIEHYLLKSLEKINPTENVTPSSIASSYIKKSISYKEEVQIPRIILRAKRSHTNRSSHTQNYPSKIVPIKNKNKSLLKNATDEEEHNIPPLQPNFFLDSIHHIPFNHLKNFKMQNLSCASQFELIKTYLHGSPREEKINYNQEKYMKYFDLAYREAEFSARSWRKTKWEDKIEPEENSDSIPSLEEMRSCTDNICFDDNEKQSLSRKRKLSHTDSRFKIILDEINEKSIDENDLHEIPQQSKRDLVKNYLEQITNSNKSELSFIQSDVNTQSFENILVDANSTNEDLGKLIGSMYSLEEMKSDNQNSKFSVEERRNEKQQNNYLESKLEDREFQLNSTGTSSKSISCVDEFEIDIDQCYNMQAECNRYCNIAVDELTNNKQQNFAQHSKPHFLTTYEEIDANQNIFLQSELHLAKMSSDVIPTLEEIISVERQIESSQKNKYPDQVESPKKENTQRNIYRPLKEQTSFLNNEDNNIKESVLKCTSTYSSHSFLIETDQKKVDNSKSTTNLCNTYHKKESLENEAKSLEPNKTQNNSHTKCILEETTTEDISNLNATTEMLYNTVSKAGPREESKESEEINIINEYIRNMYNVALLKRHLKNLTKIERILDVTGECLENFKQVQKEFKVWLQTEEKAYKTKDKSRHLLTMDVDEELVLPLGMQGQTWLDDLSNLIYDYKMLVNNGSLKRFDNNRKVYKRNFKINHQTKSNSKAQLETPQETTPKGLDDSLDLGGLFDKVYPSVEFCKPIKFCDPYSIPLLPLSLDVQNSDEVSPENFKIRNGPKLSAYYSSTGAPIIEIDYSWYKLHLNLSNDKRIKIKFLQHANQKLQKRFLLFFKQVQNFAENFPQQFKQQIILKP